MFVVYKKEEKPMWLRFATFAAFLTLVGCGGSDNKEKTVNPDPAPSATTSVSTQPAGKLKFRLTDDKCVIGYDVVGAVSSGFKPGGEYTTTAKYPDGRPYTDIGNPGFASATGTTPNWRWDCTTRDENRKLDPPGLYRITVREKESGRSVSVSIRAVKPREK